MIDPLIKGCIARSYTSALQTIALFGLKLNRFPAMVGATVFLVLYVHLLHSRMSHTKWFPFFQGRPLSSFRFVLAGFGVCTPPDSYSIDPLTFF